MALSFQIDKFIIYWFQMIDTMMEATADPKFEYMSL